MSDSQQPPSSATNPLANGTISSAGSSAQFQHWLLGCSLEFKPLVNSIQEIFPFFTKQMLPGAGAHMLIPTAGVGIGSLKIFSDIMQALKGGGALVDCAFDLTPEQVEALMQARASGISDPDNSASVSIQSLGALRNVAMNQAMMSGNDGPSVG